MWFSKKKFNTVTNIEKKEYWELEEENFRLKKEKKEVDDLQDMNEKIENENNDLKLNNVELNEIIEIKNKELKDLKTKLGDSSRNLKDELAKLDMFGVFVVIFDDEIIENYQRIPKGILKASISKDDNGKLMISEIIIEVGSPFFKNKRTED